MKKLVNRLNKKGQDLSIGTLILIVLGIVVLVLLVLGFTMGWDNLWEKINIFGGTSSVGDIVTACRLAHTSQDAYTLCDKTWDIKNSDGTKETGVSCQKLKDTGRLDLDFTCTTKTYAQLCTIANGVVKDKENNNCPKENGNNGTIVSINGAQPENNKICCKYTNAEGQAATDTYAQQCIAQGNNAAVMDIAVGGGCPDGNTEATTGITANRPAGKRCCRPN